MARLVSSPEAGTTFAQHSVTSQALPSKPSEPRLTEAPVSSTREPAGFGDAGDLSKANAADKATASQISEVSKSGTGTADPTVARTRTFQSVGYVEKPDGTLEAIILQDDRTTVVHMGDVIGTCRVTKIAPDAVEAVEETMSEASAKPEVPSQALGIVERADGSVDEVVPDGEHVRLVPQRPETAMASKVSPDRESVHSAASKPVGTGQMVSALKQTDETHNEPLLGPHGAGAANGVDNAVAYSNPSASAPLSMQRSQKHSNSLVSEVRQKSQNVALSAMPAAHSQPPTFVFQTLGYVECPDGQIAAIVSEDGRMFLVKQGERFADIYRATSVDQGIVVAVRSNPGWDVDKLLASRAEPDTKSASKQVYGKLQVPQTRQSQLSASRGPGMLAGPRLKDFGVDLIDSSWFATLNFE